MARTKKNEGRWCLSYSDPLTPGTIESWAARCAQTGREKEAQQGRDLANEIRVAQAETAEDAPDPSEPGDPEESAEVDPVD